MASDKELSNWNVALRLLLLGFYGWLVTRIFSEFLGDPEAVVLLKLFVMVLYYIALGLPWAYFRILNTDAIMINTSEENSKYAWMYVGGMATMVIAMLPLIMIHLALLILADINILHYIAPPD